MCDCSFFVLCSSRFMCLQGPSCIPSDPEVLIISVVADGPSSEGREKAALDPQCLISLEGSQRMLLRAQPISVTLHYSFNSILYIFVSLALFETGLYF